MTVHHNRLPVDCSLFDKFSPVVALCATTDSHFLLPCRHCSLIFLPVLTSLLSLLLHRNSRCPCHCAATCSSQFMLFVPVFATFLETAVADEPQLRHNAVLSPLPCCLCCCLLSVHFAHRYCPSCC